MNKEELLKEISKTEEHLATMKKMLTECEYERWKPKILGCYYFVTDNLTVARENFEECSDYDICKYNAYNCFKTREEAEQEAEKILVRRQLEDIARRLNKGEKIDWEDASQDKHYTYLDTEVGDLIYGDTIWCKTQGVVYCLDQDFLDVAVQEIGEERLKKYLRGE